MDQFNIILTVPHAIPLLNTNIRSSDVSALPMAEILESLFKPICNIFLIKSKQNRQILDDNRYSNIDGNYTILNDSGLWQELKECFIINKLDYAKTIIIDCHSFYKNGFNEKSSTEVVILDYIPYQSLSMGLIDGLSNAQILTGKIGSNSILDVFRLHPYQMTTILLEVREDLSHVRLHEIGLKIKEIIMYYFKYDINKSNFKKLNTQTY